MRTSIVNVGIDTVKVNVKVLDPDGKVAKSQTVSEQLSILFQVWQEQAQVNNKPVATGISFYDARLMMFPNGASAWKYILRNDCLEIKLVPRLDMPMIAKVTLLSSYLWAVGSVEQAIGDVHELIKSIFGQHMMLQAGQIDLCVDIAGFVMPKNWINVFVSKARGKSPIGQTDKDREFFRGRKLETLNISGHGCPVNGKLYNKVVEIAQKHPDKIWFHDIWKMNGWDGESTVWRVEFSIEREGLHQMKLEDIYETIDSIERIWSYCTHEWLRMVKPQRDTNWRRWPTSSTWEMVQDAFEAYKEKENGLGPIVRQRIREKNIERAVAAFAGYSTTYAAWEDMALDTDTCTPELFSLIYDKVVERWGKQGISPVDVIRDKKLIYSQVP